MTEAEAFLVFNAVPGLGGLRLDRLLQACGGAMSLLAAGREELASLGILSEGGLDQWCGFDRENFLRQEREVMARQGVRAVYYKEDSYPARLKEIPGAPPVLYYKGDLGIVHSHPGIAMVGARKASHYGLEVAGRFAARLGELGLVVISGLARGIDTAAHRGALKAKGKTAAVLGSGLGYIYPPENDDLAEQVSRCGVLLSEFSMMTRPLPQHFPRRNRIISGLSLGVVVVEAAVKSGALITSDYALQQGREVFAVPGQVDTPTARGTHHLIQQGAKLISGVEDILEELAIPLRAACPGEENVLSARPLLSEEEAQVLEGIGPNPRHIDDLSADCPVPFAVLSAALFRLELKRLVRQLPGKYFVRH